MKISTLTARLVLFTSAWMIVALVFIAVIVSADYRNNSEKQFGDVLFATLNNLLGSFERLEDGSLAGAPRLGDSRYKNFQSGWYWSVHEVNNGGLKKTSSSLAGQTLSDNSAPKYDTNFQRSFLVTDQAGNEILVVQAQVFLGEGDDLYRFSTTGNIGVLNADISAFRTRLIGLLIAFGVGLIATSFFVVRIGLNPIRTATNQLAEIRNGKAKQIEGEFPTEILPLINEANALIESNRAIVERSRTQVGNLAHSLKTPLSVSTLELEKLPVNSRQIISGELAAMRDQIQTYLNRAMISARHGSITSRTNADAALLRMVSTFAKLFPALEFNYSTAVEGPYIFAGEQQDFEEIMGNILENSGKFAKNDVSILLGCQAIDGNQFLKIEVDDDGPGLSEAEIDYVLKRGNRLDENKPGTGLGLSIVKDIVGEYKGKLHLGKSPSGGLKVIINLPAIEA